MTVTVCSRALLSIKLLSDLAAATPLRGRGYIRPWGLCSAPVIPTQSSVCVWERARHLLQILALAAEHPLLRGAVKGCVDQLGQQYLGFFISFSVIAAPRCGVLGGERLVHVLCDAARPPFAEQLVCFVNDYPFSGTNLFLYFSLMFCGVFRRSRPSSTATYLL